MWILEQAIKICHKHHMPVCIGGKTPTQYPAILEKLVHWGVTSINVEPNEIHSIRKHITDAERNRIEQGKKN
jgi:pyruvate,water dikinase